MTTKSLLPDKRHRSNSYSIIGLKETISSNKKSNVKKSIPILKWAGGKGQLLPVLRENYPKELKNNKIKTYIEPFIGGGAVFFDIANQYKIKSSYLFDKNHELIILYNTIKSNPNALIKELSKIESKYLSLNDSKRKDLFYKIREQYNQSLSDVLQEIKRNYVISKRAAQTVFLNRTCFNGLFRVNSKGHFNVPHGRYANPTILFEDKIKVASKLLQNTTIALGDFSLARHCITKDTFIYYDPPYRPISKSSNFTSYSKEQFDDDEQIRLSKLFEHLDKENIMQMMSNSDPSNYINDPFFDKLYFKYNIERIHARRVINSNSSKRGALTELIIKNY